MKTNRNWIALCGIILMGGLVQCVDRIPIDVPSEKIQNLVFDARLILGDPSIAIINVTHLLDLAQSRSLALNIKDTYMVSEDGAELILERVGEGNYQVLIPRNHPFKLIPGKKYKARVEIKDGRIYESAYDVLSTDAGGSSYSTEIITKPVQVDQTLEDKPFIRISGKLPTISNNRVINYKWEWERVARITDSPIDGSEPKTCYIQEHLNSADLDIISGKNIAVAEIDLDIADFPITFSYAEDAYIILQQQIISDSAFLYWENVSKLINREGRLFEDPPGRLKGNFSNSKDPEDEVFGLFYCINQQTIRLFIDQNQVGNPLPLCPPRVPPSPNPCPISTCCNCLSAAKSSLTKPIWWIN